MAAVRTSTTSARFAALPSIETVGAESEIRPTSKPGGRVPTMFGVIGTVAVPRSGNTDIWTWTVAGSTSTLGTFSPSSPTGVRVKSRSMSISEDRIDTFARTSVTRAMSVAAPRTVAVLMDGVGLPTASPSGTAPTTMSTGTSFGSTFSRWTDTNAGVADRTWIRGSAEVTWTRTDWATGPGWT